MTTKQPLVVARDRSQHRALGLAAIVATAAILWVVLPVAIGILLGALLAFMLQPAFERLELRMGARTSAMVLVIVSTLTLAGLLAGLGLLLATKGSVLTAQLIAALGPEGPAGAALSSLGRLAARVGIPPDQLPTQARDLVTAAGTRAAGAAQAIVSLTASWLVALFFSMLAMYFFLRQWKLVARAARELLPLRPEYTQALIADFRKVGRTTLLGTLITGLVQGLLATLGYWITGVPEPIFFGAATAVASLVPAVGTLFIWVPVGIGLMLTGHPAAGMIELGWGTLVVVGVSDYFVRPRLIGANSQQPSLVTFAALFGGVEVFGLKGLIVGPLLMSTAFAVLRLYASEQARRRSELPAQSTADGSAVVASSGLSGG